MQSANTIDKSEIEKFQAMAEEWWDPKGKFKPLHMLNPTRLRYIVDQICVEFDRDNRKKNPFSGLRILDIGCGGGLLSEPMHRLGAEVVGVDAADRNIKVAEIHAKKNGFSLDYRVGTTTSLLSEGESFDVILNMEVIEHVSDPSVYAKECFNLLKPNGLMICSTINRNFKSYLMLIIGAEHILRWLPKGTHDWAKFITPKELEAIFEMSGLTSVDMKGFVFNPASWGWSLSPSDLSVNYVMACKKEV